MRELRESVISVPWSLEACHRAGRASPCTLVKEAASARNITTTRAVTWWICLFTPVPPRHR